MNGCLPAGAPVAQRQPAQEEPAHRMGDRAAPRWAVSNNPWVRLQAMRETRQVGGVRRDAVECLRVRSLHARPSSRADGCTGSASPPRDAD